jgi:AcrR family transcriptional regulator
MPEAATPTRAERLREQLKGEIVEAAFAEFAERGYHQTKIADIARRLGIGHGSFYLHFENKRDILEHVVDEAVRRWTGLLSADNAPEAAGSADDWAAQAVRIGEAVGAMIDDDPRIARFLLFEATSIDAALTRRLFDLYEAAIAMTVAYLEHGVLRGYLRADLDTAATADGVAGMTLALIMRALLTPMTPADRRARHRATIRLMIDGARA